MIEINQLTKHIIWRSEYFFVFFVQTFLVFWLTKSFDFFKILIENSKIYTKNISEFGSAFVHALPVGDAALANEFARVAANGERIS